MKTKKKFYTLILLFTIMITVVSCVDVVQIIDFADGKYNFKIRFTVSKALLELSDTDIDDIKKEFDSDDFSIPYDEEKSIDKIDTPCEFGYDIAFSINPKTSDKDKMALLPKVQKDGKIQIPLFTDDDVSEVLKSPSDQVADAFAGAILSTAKWQLFISKKIIPTISNAYLSKKYGTMNLEFFEVGTFYCIEIPISELTKNCNLIIEK